MSISSIPIVLVVVVIFIIMMFLLRSCNNMGTSAPIEGFDATGLVYNQFPAWFTKMDYDVNQWYVRNYNEAIEASCLPYSRASKYGSLENINYLSNAMRFWRF